MVPGQVQHQQVTGEEAECSAQPVVVRNSLSTLVS